MKEIIIDGVNVAGCEFAVKFTNDNRIRCHCVKGLLRLDTMYEQPLSALCENNPNCYYKQLKRLEQENEKLKEENESLKEVKDFMSDNLDIALKDKFKYKSALEEIREILRDNIKLRTKGLEVEIHPEHTFLMEIYNKINEVLK